MNNMVPIVNDQSQIAWRSNFISWLGNKEANVYVTDILFYVLMALLAFTILMLWVFKRKIALREANKINNYKVKHNTNKSPWNVWMTISGIIVLGFLIARSILFYQIGYPRTWESLPIHMCRLIAVFIALILIFNKSSLMKYILPVAFITGIIGLVVQDASISFKVQLNDQNATNPLTMEWLNQFQSANKYYWLPGGAGNSGQWQNGQVYTIHYTLDTMIWWDIILLHMFTVLCPIVMAVAHPFKYALKEVILTWLFYLIAVFFIVGLDMALGLSNNVPSTFGHDWKANYWYFGFDKYNHYFNFINLPIIINGQTTYLSSWPTMIGTYYFIGVVWVLLFSFILALQDTIVFFENKKFLQFKKSDKFCYWVSSWKERLI